MYSLSNTVTRKFVDDFDLENLEIQTDDGWASATKILKTVPYEKYTLRLDNGFALECADDHIVFDVDLAEVFVKNLSVGELVQTEAGPQRVLSVERTGNFESMFDIAVEHPNHRFFTNGVLSHNTTIINALCYALYNKAFDSITLQRLINSTNATKNTQMEVRLTFEKDQAEYEVFRARGTEYKVEIRKNGEDITPGKGAVECDALLVEIIGISYELFTKTVIFSGNSPAFLQLPLFQQRNQIEELFNITILSEKAALLKEKIRSTEQDIKIAEAVVKQQEIALESHRKHIRDAEGRVSRWEETRSREISEIQNSLRQIEVLDFDAEKVLHDERSRLKESSSYLASKLTPRKKDLQILTKDVERLIGEQTHLMEAKCPYCFQSLADAAQRLPLIENQIAEKGEKLFSVEAEVLQLSEDLESERKKLTSVEGRIQHQNLDELMKIRENAAVLRKKLNDLRDALNPHVEARDTLISEKIVAVDSTKVDRLRRRLDHQNFLLKLLTDKNSFLRQRIINKSIPFLNERLNYFTMSLGLPHVVRFDADMSCTVSEFGRELDFGNLSAGEKKRVNTAMTLAFRDVLHHLHSKINLMLVDELDGALDQNGIDAIIRMLKEKSRDEGISVFVISHHPSIAGRLDRNLRIVKENGFSSAISEDT